MSEKDMATFLMISRHTPAKCPMFNETTRKAYVEWFAKQPFNQQGLKLDGGWTVPNEHQSFFVVEAPSSEVLLQVSMQPEVVGMLASETIEVKPAVGMEAAMKLLQVEK